MKRTIFLLLMFFSLTTLSSCKENVNMEVLTEYQSKDFLAKVTVSCEARKYSAEIERSGNALVLSILSPDIPRDTVFISDEDKMYVRSGDTLFPFSHTAAPRLVQILELFSISAADTWTIKKTVLGKVPVYVCENGSVMLYVDACSYLPLKLCGGEIDIDIISFSISSK